MQNSNGKVIFESSKKLLIQEIPQNEVEAKVFIESLVENLKYHEWRYYVKNEPLLSDFEYDTLYKKLEKAENQFPQLVVSDSPTQRVSNDLIDDFQSVLHLVPMLSLDNSYNADDLNDFDKRVKKLIGAEEDAEISYTVEPKFDGGSISLIYEDDVLVRAATRGNGTKGEEITLNAKTINSIPLKANFSKFGIKKVELRGEVLIRKDHFDTINIERQAKGKDIFANPRNAATGGLRMKDPKETAKRRLDAFIYQFGYVESIDADKPFVLKQHGQSIDFLGDLGFKVPVHERETSKNIKGAIAFCDLWTQKRDQYEYEIDGMVVKVDEVAIQDKCGYTSHHPRWAIAYKFKAKQATSRLLEIEYQIGKIGSITPVAKVEPVQLAGVTVTSISLHNADFIESKDIRIGDQVLIERAGDVIPYIVKSLKDIRTGNEQKVEFLTNCPSCDTLLVRNEKEAAWRCPNIVDCKAQNVQRIIFHVSKDAMDIDGFGKSYVEKFCELGFLNDMSDVYNLDYDAIQNLEGFGKRSAAKLKIAIEKAKSNPIKRVLYSLCIHHFGKKASKLIAQEVTNIFELQNWTLEDFVDIKDIGPVVAENVIEFFANPKNIEMLKRLESRGVNMNQLEADRPKVIEDSGNALFGKTILFTGTFEKMKRKEAQEKAAALGAKNLSAVSSKLDILVAGEKAGSKLKKATALGTVQILDEDAFINLLGS